MAQFRYLKNLIVNNKNATSQSFKLSFKLID